MIVNLIFSSIINLITHLFFSSSSHLLFFYRKRKYRSGIFNSHFINILHFILYIWLDSFGLSCIRVAPLILFVKFFIKGGTLDSLFVIHPLQLHLKLHPFFQYSTLLLDQSWTSSSNSSTTTISNCNYICNLKASFITTFSQPISPLRIYSSSSTYFSNQTFIYIFYIQ